jgi:hypothetical protein
VKSFAVGVFGGPFASLSQHELLLYYFLITVADRHGVSFYDYERICQLLKMEIDAYLLARNRLCERSLVACQNGIFQVLSLPELGDRHHATGSRCVKKAPSKRKPAPVAKMQASAPLVLPTGSATGQAQVLRDILKMLDQ